MGTSNSYAFNNITVDELIIEAFERCGIVGDVIDGLQYNAAKRSLNIMFSQWVNSEYPSLWVIQKAMTDIIPGQFSYTLPQNTVDILEMTAANTIRQNPTTGIPFSSAGGNASNAFSDDLTVYCQQTSANGYISFDFGTSPVIAPYVGIISQTTQTYSLVIEYSFDNVEWFNSWTPPETTYVAMQRQWWVLPAPIQARAWRIRETGGSTLDINKIYFNTNAVSVPSRRIFPLSRADYISIPNKQQTGTIANYQIDRNLTQVINLWPTPNNVYAVLIYNYARYMQDVGAFINNVDSPQRFYEALVSGLAAKIAQKFAVDRFDTLNTLAEQAYQVAIAQDVERVPLRIQPNYISYT